MQPVYPTAPLARLFPQIDLVKFVRIHFQILQNPLEMLGHMTSRGILGKELAVPGPGLPHHQRGPDVWAETAQKRNSDARTCLMLGETPVSDWVPALG